MHFSRILLPCATLVAATACTTVIPPAQRTPAPAPAPQSTRASTAATLKIPPGHLPPPGECRIWLPDVPPGQQKAANGKGNGNGKGRQGGGTGQSCRGIEDEAPLGSWVVYRPGQDRKVVHVKEMDRRRAGVVLRVNVFDVATGALVRGG
jgi:hypothetical protein